VTKKSVLDQHVVYTTPSPAQAYTGAATYQGGSSLYPGAINGFGKHAAQEDIKPPAYVHHPIPSNSGTPHKRTAQEDLKPPGYVHQPTLSSAATPYKRIKKEEQNEAAPPSPPLSHPPPPPSFSSAPLPQFGPDTFSFSVKNLWNEGITSLNGPQLLPCGLVVLPDGRVGRIDGHVLTFVNGQWVFVYDSTWDFVYWKSQEQAASNPGGRDAGHRRW
jgi:hypothetical protein